MKRWLEWTMVLGVGGALAVGCVSRQTEDGQQVGKPYTPIQQKYKSPSASESQSGQESGTGGAGSGLATPDNWQEQHTYGESREGEGQGGPYLSNRPQEIPRERRNAPLGVGGGPDNARKMAMDQLKNQDSR
ncbi:hypothetical protein F0U61_46825 [Archangium violaceum]|uniref:hypothetical protein n=1 Tax=Archangium violaceum TaxID=83451 RepID=UPI002B2DA871|nr:hypothetical protein F0U61_46825 [Archangium violaceum]